MFRRVGENNQKCLERSHESGQGFSSHSWGTIGGAKANAGRIVSNRGMQQLTHTRDAAQAHTQTHASSPTNIASRVARRTERKLLYNRLSSLFFSFLCYIDMGPIDIWTSNEREREREEIFFLRLFACVPVLRGREVGEEREILAPQKARESESHVTFGVVCSRRRFDDRRRDLCHATADLRLPAL